jgi:hypothetical protein
VPRITDALRQRFADLEQQMRRVPVFTNRQNYSFTEIEPYNVWASSALNAIDGAFGRESTHTTHFSAQIASVKHNVARESEFRALCGLFLGAKSDVDGGFVFALERSVAGEVFADIVSAAKAALSEGDYTVATVLASAAL